MCHVLDKRNSKIKSKWENNKNVPYLAAWLAWLQSTPHNLCRTLSVWCSVLDYEHNWCGKKWVLAMASYNSIRHKVWSMQAGWTNMSILVLPHSVQRKSSSYRKTEEGIIFTLVIISPCSSHPPTCREWLYLYQNKSDFDQILHLWILGSFFKLGHPRLKKEPNIHIQTI